MPASTLQLWSQGPQFAAHALRRAARSVRARYLASLQVDPFTRATIRDRGDLLHLGSTTRGWAVPDSLLKTGATCFVAPAVTHEGATPDEADGTFERELGSRYQCDVGAWDGAATSLPTSGVDVLALTLSGRDYRALDDVLDRRVPVRVLCVDFAEVRAPADLGGRSRVRARVQRLGRHGFDLVHTEGRGDYTFVHRG